VDRLASSERNQYPPLLNMSVLGGTYQVINL